MVHYLSEPRKQDVVPWGQEFAQRTGTLRRKHPKQSYEVPCAISPFLKYLCTCGISVSVPMLKSFSAQTLLLAVAAAVVSHEANIVINEI